MQDKQHEHDEEKPKHPPAFPKHGDPKKGGGGKPGPKTTADDDKPPAPPTGGLDNDGDDQGN